MPAVTVFIYPEDGGIARCQDYGNPPQRQKLAAAIQRLILNPVNLPLGLVDAGLNIASKYAPDVAFDELVDAISAGAEGKIIDVYDEEDGEHVEIFIE